MSEMSDIPSDTFNASTESDTKVSEQLNSAVRSIPRRHDLDALRAIAMSAGIVLHGLLSFAPRSSGGWAVADDRQSWWLDFLMASIHGFRMPLFFLISGFFTAMLWRKRGLVALMKHRFFRIVIPLLLGLVTIIPISNAAFRYGYSQRIARQEAMDLQAAITSGDLDAVRSLIDDESINAEENKVTPLGLAAIRGHVQIVRLLLESGAEPNQIFGDQKSGALNAAAFFGRSECVQVLLDGGADPMLKDKDGGTALGAARAPIEIAKFLAGMMQMELNEEETIAGRNQSIELLRKAMPEGSPKDANVPADRVSETPEAKTKSIGDLYGWIIFVGSLPIFHHLWFLWFLCWLVVAFAIYSFVMNRLGIQAWSPKFVASPLRYAWLLPVTFVFQILMLQHPGFGPDTSVGYIPYPHLLGYYGVFFFFGAMYFDCNDEAQSLGRWWWLTIPFALLVLLPIGYETTYGGLGFGDQIPQAWHKSVSNVIQVVYVWLMTFGAIGLFRHFFSRRSHVMRYVSDSSYWLYLAHLPLIVVLQSLVAKWQMPVVIKLTLVCVVSTAILLLSYEYLVRYTLIGTMLNGKKHRTRRSDEPQTTQAPARPA